MTYKILIGERCYSSWSLRGGLLFSKFGIETDVQSTNMYEPSFREDLKAFAPARTVPVVALPEGGMVMDTLAIAETLAERHPKKHMWPADTAARALARGMTAEMHSSFGAIRGFCPMNLHTAWRDVPVDDKLQSDIDRIEALWTAASTHATDGPWLFGAYSIADAFYAPVAARMVGYGLPVSAAARAYCQTVITDPDFVEWRRLGLKQSELSVYDQPYDRAPWPGPA